MEGAGTFCWAGGGHTGGRAGKLMEPNPEGSGVAARAESYFSPAASARSRRERSRRGTSSLHAEHGVQHTAGSCNPEIMT